MLYEIKSYKYSSLLYSLVSCLYCGWISWFKLCVSFFISIQIIHLISSVLYSANHYNRDTGIFLAVLSGLILAISLVVVILEDKHQELEVSILYFLLILGMFSFINGVVMLDSYLNFKKNSI